MTNKELREKLAEFVPIIGGEGPHVYARNLDALYAFVQTVSQERADAVVAAVEEKIDSLDRQITAHEMWATLRAAAAKPDGPV